MKPIPQQCIDFQFDSTVCSLWPAQLFYGSSATAPTLQDFVSELHDIKRWYMLHHSIRLSKYTRLHAGDGSGYKRHLCSFNHLEACRRFFHASLALKRIRCRLLSSCSLAPKKKLSYSVTWGGYVAILMTMRLTFAWLELHMVYLRYWTEITLQKMRYRTEIDRTWTVCGVRALLTAYWLGCRQYLFPLFSTKSNFGLLFI